MNWPCDGAGEWHLGDLASLPSQEEHRRRQSDNPGAVMASDYVPETDHEDDLVERSFQEGKKSVFDDWWLLTRGYQAF